jgi:hypothetical protein
MKTRIAIFALLAALSHVQLFAEKDYALSELAQVSLITQDPGKEVYLAFGHSAIRVRDPLNGFDVLFNYGVFSASSLDDPLFIPRFVYGELDYMVYPFQFDSEIQYDLETQNRVWYEQTLNLTRDEIDTLYRFLAWNVLPENRVYRYDFIKDNCSTRVIDALQKCTGNAIDYERNSFYTSGKTYRSLIDEKLEHRPFWNLAINIGLGSESDKQIDAKQSMYIPSYMMDIFDSATIRHGNVIEPLVKKKSIVLAPPAPANYDSPDTSMNGILWPLFAVVLALTIFQIARSKKKGIGDTLPERIADTTLVFLFGALGCVVFFMSVISTHTATKGNFNMLWLLPTNIAMAFTLLSKNKSRWQEYYWIVAALLCLVSLPPLKIFPQNIHADVMPLQLILATRFIRAALRKSGRG